MEYKKEPILRFLLSGLYEFFPAFGAGDRDLTFSFGYPHLLAAPGTGEIAVLAVLDPVQQHQKFPVFLVALVGVSGKAPEHGPEHKAIGHHCQKKIHHRGGNKQRYHTHRNACQQNHGVELVGSVTPGHKSGQTHTKSPAQLPKPISKSIHVSITLV